MFAIQFRLPSQPAFSFLACSLLAATSLTSASLAQAQPAASGRSYTRSSYSAVMGRGMHAYFNGNMAHAEQMLTTVLQAGSQDPRAYYFRALARQSQNRTHEAEQDMQTGAALEAHNPARSQAVSRSLIRVQGPTRRILEGYRRQARLAPAIRTEQIAATPPSDSLAQHTGRLYQAPITYDPPSADNTYVMQKPVQIHTPSLAKPSLTIAMPNQQPATAGSPAPAPALVPVAPAATPQPALSLEEAFNTEPQPIEAEETEEMVAEKAPEESSADDFGFGDATDDFATDEDETPTVAKISEPIEALQQAGAEAAVEADDTPAVTDESKVPSSTLWKVLGRAAGETMPGRGIELPAMSSLPGMGPGAPPAAAASQEPPQEVEFAGVDDFGAPPAIATPAKTLPETAPPAVEASLEEPEEVDFDDVEDFGAPPAIAKPATPMPETAPPAATSDESADDIFSSDDFGDDVAADDVAEGDVADDAESEAPFTDEADDQPTEESVEEESATEEASDEESSTDDESSAEDEEEEDLFGDDIFDVE